MALENVSLSICGWDGIYMKAGGIGMGSSDGESQWYLQMFNSQRSGILPANLNNGQWKRIQNIYWPKKL